MSFHPPGRKRGEGFRGTRKDAHEFGVAEIAAFLNHSAVAIEEQAPASRQCPADFMMRSMSSVVDRPGWKGRNRI